LTLAAISPHNQVMKRKLVFLALLVMLPLPALAADINMVFFYSPTCGHCHEVMSTILPELQNQYGSRLKILGLNVDEPEVEAMMNLALRRYDPSLSPGTPVIMIGDDLLQGRNAIMARLKTLVASYLASGGADWPDLPGLSKYTETPQPPAAAPQQAPLSERFARDKAGNTLAVIVLVVLIAALPAALWPAAWQKRLQVPDVLMLALAGLGLLIAAYLAWVEMTNTAAICGPVGDCNAVQASQYALLFNFLPVGLLGVIGYVAILAATIGAIIGKSAWRQRSNLLAFLLCSFGLSFSIYLTFLEPFVIGATCAWCLTSALIMAALTLMSSARWRGGI